MFLDAFTADDGQQIHVQVSGGGKPLILLHEWASNHHVWETIAHRLNACFTIYRWDARGHGLSQPHGRPVTVERMADDLADLIRHYGLHQPLVVGHSMGALTLWCHIARHGCAHLGRICVIDQSPRLMTDENWRFGIYGDWPRDRDNVFIDAMGRDFVSAVIELISLGLNQAARRRYDTNHAGVGRLRTYLAHLDSQPLIEVWPTLSRADFRPVLTRISVPTLLVYGSNSNFYPPATGAYVQDAIGEAELVIYEGADHSPHVGQPDRFVGDLLRFADR